MSEASSQVSKIASAASSFIEKATEFRFFLLLSSFIILTDNCLGVFYQKNIFQIENTWPIKELTVGGSFFLLGLYAFLMAVFFPALRVLLGMALVAVYHTTGLADVHKEKDKDLKYPLLVMRDAIIDKDSFTLDLVRRHNEKAAETNKNLVLGFSLGALLAVNYLVGSVTHPSFTLMVGTFVRTIEGFWPYVAVMALAWSFLFLVVTLSAMALNPNANDKMDLPSKPVKPTLMPTAHNENFTLNYPLTNNN